MVEYKVTILGKELTIKYLTELEEVKTALTPMYSERVIGFDTETTGLEALRGAKWRLSQLAKTDGEIAVVDMWKCGRGAYEEVAKLLSAEYPVKAMHNGKFDTKFVRNETKLRLMGRIFDSMLAAQVLAFGDITQRVGLDSCLVRYCGESISKDEQTSDWGQYELSESQIIYAGIDAYVNLCLREAMIPKIIDSGTVQTCQIEFDCVDAFALMELNGFYLNQDRWKEQIVEAINSQQDASARLFELSAPAFDQNTLFSGTPLFNPRSPKQLIECFERLGVPLPEDNGKVTTRGWRLKYLVNDYPVVGALLDFREWAKRTSSYGESYLDFVNPTTGRIHADFRSIGALTGRMSSGRPNLQQLPNIEMFRRCFTPQFEDTKLVVADYSAIELRILADYSQEPNFVNAFLNGDDLHTLTGCRLFNTTPDRLTKAQRNFAKTINFGIAYGMGAQTLSIRTGETMDYSERALEDYRDQNPVLCEWLEDIADQALRTGEVRTYSGRLVKLNFDRRDRKSVGDARRNGKNTPPQGGCADIVKLSVGMLHKELAQDRYFHNDEPLAKLVNVVHDEKVLESKDHFAEEAGAILSDCMVKAGEHFIHTIPVEADYEILDKWWKS